MIQQGPKMVTRQMNDDFQTMQTAALVYTPKAQVKSLILDSVTYLRSIKGAEKEHRELWGSEMSQIMMQGDIDNQTKWNEESGKLQ
jgi:hypothetical protein